MVDTLRVRKVSEMFEGMSEAFQGSLEGVPNENGSRGVLPDFR